MAPNLWSVCGVRVLNHYRGIKGNQRLGKIPASFVSITATPQCKTKTAMNHLKAVFGVAGYNSEDQIPSFLLFRAPFKIFSKPWE